MAMTGFIKPNAVNLLDFQCKPIRGHAGGKITTREMMENSHCFPARANFCAFLSGQAVILSSADNCHRSGCAENNGVKASCYHQGLRRRVIYICVICLEQDGRSLFSLGNLENSFMRHSHLQNNLGLYKHLPVQ